MMPLSEAFLSSFIMTLDFGHVNQSPHDRTVDILMKNSESYTAKRQITEREWKSRKVEGEKTGGDIMCETSSSTLWHASSVLSSHYISLMEAQQCVWERERERRSDEPPCQSDL